MMDDGDNVSYKSCKVCQIVTTHKPTHNFLQARCPSCHPTNSVKALKDVELLIYYQTIISFTHQIQL